MSSNCDNCVYYIYLESIQDKCCNYLIQTGQRRPCPPGDGCTVKVGKHGKWQTWWHRKKKKGDSPM